MLVLLAKPQAPSPNVRVGRSCTDLCHTVVTILAFAVVCLGICLDTLVLAGTRYGSLLRVTSQAD